LHCISAICFLYLIESINHTIMKRFLFLLVMFFFGFSLFAGDVFIDKKNCTITKNGKTFPLHGKVAIVENFADFDIKIVDSFEDAAVVIDNSFPDGCCEWKIVGKNEFPDFTIRIVSSFEDMKVKFVTSFPGLKK